MTLRTRVRAYLRVGQCKGVRGFHPSTGDAGRAKVSITRPRRNELLVPGKRFKPAARSGNETNQRSSRPESRRKLRRAFCAASPLARSPARWPHSSLASLASLLAALAASPPRCPRAPAQLLLASLLM